MKTLRMLTSWLTRQSMAAMRPFMSTPAAATNIMMRGWTGDGMAEALDGFEGDPAGDDDQRERVEEGGEDAGALVAEGLLISGRAGLKPDGDEGEHDGEGIRGIVAGFRDEGEGVGAQAGDQERNHDVGDGGDEGEAQHPLHGRGIGAMNMHTGSVYPGRATVVHCTGAEAWGLRCLVAGRAGTESAVVRRPLQFSATTMLFSGR